MRLARQDGASAVEFAIISILLFMLLFGIIEFSIALYDNAKIADAARHGVRTAVNFRLVPNPSDPTEAIYEHFGQAGICAIVEAEMELAITFGATGALTCGSNTTDDIQVIWCNDPTDCENTPVAEADVDGTDPDIPIYVEVTVRYSYDFLVMPGFIPILGDSINMTRRARMRLERGV